MKSFSYFLFVWVFAFQACSQAPKSTKAMDQLPTSEAEWKAKLSEEEFYILRQKGTERPYTGKFLMHVDKGYYTCKGCGTRLFKSDSKFDSHCGWPSFDKEIKEGVIKETPDLTLGMRRIEITCAKCGGHLGHVFDDGPTETGLRYCVNSVSLGFEKDK
jgi:methionine-R-sulfoxide reductase